MMKIKLDAFVAEVARNLDLEILKHNPDVSKFARAQRFYVIFDFLRKEDVVRDTTEEGQESLRPSARLEQYFGAERHGIADEYEEVIDPTALSAIHMKLGDELRIRGGEALEADVGLVISLFGMYRLGELEYCGKEEDGLCQFRPNRKFGKSMSRGAPTRIVECVDEPGRVRFTEQYD
jgi:hypothetical protein